MLLGQDIKKATKAELIIAIEEQYEENSKLKYSLRHSEDSIKNLKDKSYKAKLALTIILDLRFRDRHAVDYVNSEELETLLYIESLLD